MVFDRLAEAAHHNPTHGFLENPTNTYASLWNRHELLVRWPGGGAAGKESLARVDTGASKPSAGQ